MAQGQSTARQIRQPKIHGALSSIRKSATREREERSHMAHARIPPPWKVSPSIRKRQAKLARLRSKGLLPAGDKASLRAAASAAVGKSKP